MMEVCRHSGGDGICSHHGYQFRALRRMFAIRAYWMRLSEEYYCGLCGKMMPMSHFPH